MGCQFSQQQHAATLARFFLQLVQELSHLAKEQRGELCVAAILEELRLPQQRRALSRSALVLNKFADVEQQLLQQDLNSCMTQWERSELDCHAHLSKLQQWIRAQSPELQELFLGQPRRPLVLHGHSPVPS
eukprot:835913-Rhodomonas_salina.2